MSAVGWPGPGQAGLQQQPASEGGTGAAPPLPATTAQLLHWYTILASMYTCKQVKDDVATIFRGGPY